MGSSAKSWVVWIVVIFVGGSIFSACTSADRDTSGEVVDSGTVSAFEMRVGDCFNDSFDGGITSFSEANAVPCDQSHAWEAYYSSDLDDGNFPTDLSAQANMLCELTLAGLINGIVDESPYTFVSVYPTQNSWENGNDREVVCLVGMYDGTNSMGRLFN